MTRIRLLSSSLLVSLVLVALAGRAGTGEPPLVPEALSAQAAAQGTVRVIVRLNAPFAPEGLLGSLAHVAGQRQVLAGVQRAVRAQLRGVRHRVVREFDGRLPLLAIEASPEALQMLATLRGIVAEVEEDVAHPPLLVQSVPLINGNDVWALGSDGTGQIVVVLDTGVQKSHPFLSGKVIAEACFSSTTAISTSVCPGGTEAAFGANAALPCPVDGCDHGTHVAGIAAGRGSTFSGVAKGASIIAIQVFSRFGNNSDCGGFPGAAPCVRSFTSDQIAALNYVHAQRLIFPGRRIAAVNMSLGGQGFTGPCDGAPQKLAIDQLRAPHPSDPMDPGVATVIAAGNAFLTDAISSPACISTAIPVASSTKADGASSFTNMASPTLFPGLLFAPGSSIQSSVPTNAFAFFSGTSMAAPHVVGAFAVLRQIAPTAPVTELLDVLKATGQPILDDRPVCFGCDSGGHTAPRIDLLAAAIEFPPNLVVQTLTAPATGVPGANLSVMTSIRNTAVLAAGASNLKLYLSDDSVITAADRLLGTIAFGSLSGGLTSPVKTLSVPIPASVTQSGTYFIGAVADADQQQDESSEADNTKSVPIQIVLSDLAVASVTGFPAVTAPGANISVTHTVRNVASAPAAAPASFSGIYLGVNQSVATAVGGRLALVSVPALAPGATSPALTATNVNVPAGTPLGRYFVLVRANDTGAFIEGSAGANVGAGGTTILVGPDLTVTSASAATGISPGANLSVTYTVKNQGGQAAGGFEVAFALAPQAGGPDIALGPGRTVASLAAGASAPFTNVVPVPPGTEPGTYKVRVTADATAAVAEADEANNAALTAVVTVGRPDLAVQSLTFTPPATRPGGGVTVTHAVKNLAPSPGAAGGSFSRLRMGPGQDLSAVTDLGLVSVPPLAPGAMATVSKPVTVPGNASVGLYYLSARADDPDTIAEPDDVNNLRFSLTRLIVGPDVLPTVASTVTGIAPGANVSVAYTLKNQGGQATSVDVSFALIPQPSGVPIPIGPGRAIATLAAGMTTAFTNSVLIPSNASPMSYRIQVRVDPAADADPSNNGILTGAINVARSNLKVQTVTFTPAVSFPGGNVTVTHTVKNVALPPGNAAGSSTLLQLGTTPTVSAGDLGLVTVPPIAAGAMVSLPKLVTIPPGTPPGLYYVLAAGDATGLVVEINDDPADNLGASTTRLIVGPDVVPTAATVPAAIVAGGNLTVTYTLKNQGGAAAGPFSVSFTLVPTGGGPDIPLSPGRAGVTIPPVGSKSLTDVVAIPIVSGPHRIRVTADAGHDVVEADEGNNSLLTTGAVNVIKANLTVPPFTFSPATSAAGGTVTVLYTIKNAAPAPGAAPATDARLFLSLNQTASGEVANLGTVAMAQVGAGLAVSKSRPVTLPGNLSAGRYFFGAQADAGNVVAESDESETSNVGYSTTPIVVGPDLVPTAATIPATIGAGGNLSVTYTLKNQGGAPTGPFSVSFALVPTGGGPDIPLTPNQAVPSIAPGSVKTLLQSLPTPSVSGPHRIRVTADAGHEVVEADEGNNSLLTTGAVNVIKANLTVLPFTFSPATSAPGGTVTVRYSIKNVAAVPGNAAASGSRLFLSVNQTAGGEVVSFGTIGLSAVGAGATVSGSRPVILPGNLSAGRYFFGTQADPNDVVAESDESEASNVGYSTTAIVVGPDLVPTAATTPATIAAGGNLNATYTLKNQGGAPSGPFAVGFALVAVNTGGAPTLPDVPLGSGQAMASIPAGGTVTRVTGLPIPSDASGLYRIRVIVDPGNDVLEADEGNNGRLTAANLNVVLPDLAMQSVTAAPGVLAPTGNVSVTQVIKNLSPAPGGVAATTSRLYLSPAPSPITALASPVIGDVAVSPIAGLGTATVTRSLPLPPGTVPGTYWVYARANAVSPAFEAGPPEQGNNLQRTLTPILVGPDLTLTTLTAPTVASPNLTIPVTSTVKNRGGQGTNGSVVRFFLSPTGVLDGSEVPLGVTSTAALAPGASFTTTAPVTIPGNTSPGSRFLLAQADGLGIAEADDTNNVIVKSVNVLTPNLQITSITIPAAAIRGRVTGAPNVSVVVKNAGAVSAAPFDVSVFANRDGNPGASTPGSGDLLFTRTVSALLPSASTTVTAPIVIPEGTAPDVRLAGHYFVSATADPTGAATGDTALGDNALTLTSKVLPVLPDMTRLHTATIPLDLQPACGIPGNHLDLQGPVDVTSQTLGNPSSFISIVTLTDPGIGFNVVYTVRGTVRALVGSTAGLIAATFTFAGAGTSGTGIINGAAPGLDFTGGVISGQQTGLPGCTFTGTVDIVR